MAAEINSGVSTKAGDGEGKSDIKLPDGAALIAAQLGEALGEAAGDGGEEGQELEGSDETGGEAESSGEEAVEGAGADETQDEEEAEGEESTEANEGNEEAKDGEEIKGLTPAIQAKLDRRINKEVGKRKVLETTLETVRAELEEAKSAGPRVSLPLEVDPVRRHPQVAAAFTEETQANRTREAAEGLLERLEGDEAAVEAALADLARVNVKVRDADEAKRVLTRLREEAVRKADRAITKREFVEEQVRGALEQERVRFDAAAVEAYAWLKDKTTEEFRTFENVLKENPWLKTWPAGKLAVADMVAGARLRMAKAKPAAGASAPGEKPKPKLPLVKLAPKTGGTPGAAPGGKGNPKEALRSQALKDPKNERARLAYMESLLGPG